MWAVFTLDCSPWWCCVRGLQDDWEAASGSSDEDDYEPVDSPLPDVAEREEEGEKEGEEEGDEETTCPPPFHPLPPPSCSLPIIVPLPLHKINIYGSSDHRCATDTSSDSSDSDRSRSDDHRPPPPPPARRPTATATARRRSPASLSAVVPPPPAPLTPPPCLPRPRQRPVSAVTRDRPVQAAAAAAQYPPGRRQTAPPVLPPRARAASSEKLADEWITEMSSARWKSRLCPGFAKLSTIEDDDTDTDIKTRRRKCYSFGRQHADNSVTFHYPVNP